MTRPLSLVAQALAENHGSFNRSGLPYRVLYYNDNTCGGSQNAGWRDFPIPTVKAFCRAFALRRPMMRMAIDQTSWFVDLRRMAMVNLETSGVRSLAWMDVRRNWFFPRSAIGCGGGGRWIEGLITGPVSFVTRSGSKRQLKEERPRSRPVLPDLNEEPSGDDK